MMRKVLATTLLGALALVVPGSGQTAAAGAGGGQIKIATLAPRGSDLEKNFKKINKKIKDATGGKWSIKFFPSGVAGDEKDVIRKMRIGQMDASIITTTGLSQIVREVAVLDAPGVIKGYKQLDRVKKEMSKEWEATFAKKGFNLMAWGEGGEYRLFSKKPINNIKDLKGMRPWLWPESEVMKQIYTAVGATGVPLGVPEVYGGLQTAMIDSVFATGIAAVGLQWWSKVDYLTEDTTGVLLFGMVMTDKRWDSLPDEVRKLLLSEVQKGARGDIKGVRKTDVRSIKKLVGRGMKTTKWDAAAKKDFNKMAAEVRSKLTGRVYPKSLLDRVQKVAGK